jgi:Cu/Ag efflux pump CusA
VSAWLAALVAPPAVGDANSGGKLALTVLPIDAGPDATNVQVQVNLLAKHLS